MEIIMMNFNEMKSATEVKNAARAEVFEKMMNFFANEYGEDNISLIGSNELAICVGTRNDAVGNGREVCVVLKPTAKDYENRVTTKKTFAAFDRAAAVKEYEIACAEKADKAVEKAVKKAEKIAKDKAARERISND